jgi:hypothetical protein
LHAFYHFVKYIKIREFHAKMSKLKDLGIPHLTAIDLEPDYISEEPEYEKKKTPLLEKVEQTGSGWSI